MDRMFPMMEQVWDRIPVAAREQMFNYTHPHRDILEHFDYSSLAPIFKGPTIALRPILSRRWPIKRQSFASGKARCSWVKQ